MAPTGARSVDFRPTIRDHGRDTLDEQLSPFDERRLLVPVLLDLDGNEAPDVCDLCTADGTDLCDGVDNDCNDEIDEDFLGELISCGVGLCAAQGRQQCLDGEVVDVCIEGEPFVGPPAQLLDRMVAALQLARAADGAPERSVYIANTLKCRPPRNRNPGAGELAQCEPFLVRQIELLKPRLILAMGRFAVQALLRTDEPIGRLRGRLHRYQGVPLVVTYHPAYLLRNPADKARAWEDLCLAAATVEGGAV